VLEVVDETDDIKTFRFARPEGFAFSPGQFVAVRVLIDGKPHVRCYSISSAPHTRGWVEISVRRQGMVSEALHATVRTGSVLTVRRPAGHFVYPADARPLVLIAGGIGITPLISMLRHAAESDRGRPITLLYSVRHERDVAFHNALNVIAEQHPLARVAITVTRATGETPFRSGRLDEAMLRQYVPVPGDAVFCLCGPTPMISGVRLMLAAMGVPESQIRFEQFDLAVAATEINCPGEEAASGAVARGPVQITFESSGVIVTAGPAQSLLETAEANGVDIMSICRAGVCQTCRTRLKCGTAHCRSDVLDPADRAAGFILPCVTWPAEDCVLEA
jgi:ferredoxin-NADP reductase